MEAFDLAVIFTAAGAVVGAGLIKTIVSAAKNMGLLPEHGRGVLYAVLALSAALVALAVWGHEMLNDGLQGGDILIIVLAILNVYTAAIGVHETAVKVQDVVAGTTNPTGPDPQ